MNRDILVPREIWLADYRGRISGSRMECTQKIEMLLVLQETTAVGGSSWGILVVVVVVVCAGEFVEGGRILVVGR